MCQLLIFTRNSTKTRKNKNSDRHDGLSEDTDIENVECEEELVKQRRENTENIFLHGA